MNVVPHILATLLADTYVTSRLGEFNNDPSIHTRRPVPEDASYPMIVIGPDVAPTNEDGLNDFRPVLTRDIAVYGEQPGEYRAVEQIAYRIWELFHRRRDRIPSREVTGGVWFSVGLEATTPQPAPTDDEKEIGRVVSLRIKLARPAYLQYPFPESTDDDDWARWGVIV